MRQSGKVKTLILSACLLLPGFVNAETENKSLIDSVATGALNLTPSFVLNGNQKLGVAEYLASIGINAYEIGYVKGGNDGVISYFSDLEEKHPRFSELSARLWREIISAASLAHMNGVIDSGELKKTTASSIEHVFVPLRVYGARLVDVTGEGRLSGLEPGWLWKLALKHAHGDKNLALYLIGSRGNDDYGILPKQKMNLPDSELRLLVDLREKMISQAPERASEITEYVNEIEKKAKEQGYINVSAPTVIFARRALGPDIPAETLQRVFKIQAPDSKAKLPAKSYHIYTAAFQACMLKQRGIPTNWIHAMQSRLVIGYRSAWLCEDLSETPKLATDVESYLKLTRKSRSFEVAFKNEIATLMLAENLNAICEQRPKDYALCSAQSIVRRFFSAPGNENRVATAADADRYAKYLLARIDLSSTLNTLVGNIFSSCGEGILASANIYYRHFKGLSKNPKFYLPRAYTPERIEEARKMAETWVVDYEFTLAQHRAGVEFGAEQCRVLNENEPSPPAGI